MPDIASFHPQVVHFVVALLIVGVLFRLVSFTGKVPFTNAAATTLIVLGTLAAVVAVESGTQAHGPAERVPGARDAVMEHEEWGERTRNVFLVVAALELVGLAVRNRKHRRIVHAAAGIIGIAGLFVLYEAAEHGGSVVYSYAGGVGIRSGAPEDVERLLVAGLYHSAMLERREGRSDDAARLFEELARQRPTDPAVQLLRVESLLRDRGEAAAALAALRALSPDLQNGSLRYRLGLLTADVHEAAGMPDSARADLEALAAAFPNSERVQRQVRERLEKLGPTGGS